MDWLTPWSQFGAFVDASASAALTETYACDTDDDAFIDSIAHREAPRSKRGRRRKGVKEHSPATRLNPRMLETLTMQLEAIASAASATRKENAKLRLADEAAAVALQRAHGLLISTRGCLPIRRRQHAGEDQTALALAEIGEGIEAAATNALYAAKRASTAPRPATLPENTSRAVPRAASSVSSGSTRSRHHEAVDSALESSLVQCLAPLDSEHLAGALSKDTRLPIDTTTRFLRHWVRRRQDRARTASCVRDASESDAAVLGALVRDERSLRRSSQRVGKYVRSLCRSCGVPLSTAIHKSTSSAVTDGKPASDSSNDDDDSRSDSDSNSDSDGVASSSRKASRSASVTPRWRAIRDPAWIKASAATTSTASIRAALPMLQQLRSACERGRVALDVTRRREKLKRAIAASGVDEQKALEAITQAQGTFSKQDYAQPVPAMSESLLRARAGAAILLAGLTALPTATSNGTVTASATLATPSLKREWKSTTKASAAKPKTQSKSSVAVVSRDAPGLLPVAVRRRGAFVS